MLEQLSVVQSEAVNASYAHYAMSQRYTFALLYSSDPYIEREIT